MNPMKRTEARIIKGKYLDYAYFDGMSWPLPTLELLEHLRQSKDPIREAAGSALTAYHVMVFDPEKKRRDVIRALRSIRHGTKP